MVAQGEKRLGPLWGTFDKRKQGLSSPLMCLAYGGGLVLGMLGLGAWGVVLALLPGAITIGRIAITLLVPVIVIVLLLIGWLKIIERLTNRYDWCWGWW